MNVTFTVEDLAAAADAAARDAMDRQWLNRTRSSRSLWLTEAALPVSVGGSSKQEKRRREDGSEPQAEALPKRQEADPVRCKRRAILQQNPLRSRRWPC